MKPTGAQIKSARVSAGLTQAELAKLLGYAARFRISEFETGSKQMPDRMWELMQYKLRIKSKGE